MFESIGAPRWIAFRNDASETAPAFGMLQPTGFTTSSGRSFVTVTKPNSTPSDFHFVNGPQDVPQGKYGYCTSDTPAMALVTDSVSPAVNQVLGPKSGEWKLFNQRGGFTALQNPASSGGRMLVGPAAVAGYAGLSGGGLMTVGTGYTKISILNSQHVAPFGCTANTATYDITVERTGAYLCTFTACVRYTSYPGAGPIFALHKNGVGYLGPPVAALVELNNSNYRSVAFTGIVSLIAGDVLDVRMNGPAEQLRFLVCQFTVHLVGVA